MDGSTQASLSITISWSFLRLMSIKLVMPSNHLILCCPLLLLPSIFPISVFSKESVLCIKWPNHWSFSFSISPSNKHLGLISFRMDWVDPLTVQGILKSLLQQHSSKASILWRSAFFIGIMVSQIIFDLLIFKWEGTDLIFISPQYIAHLVNRYLLNVFCKVDIILKASKC